MSPGCCCLFAAAVSSLLPSPRCCCLPSVAVSVSCLMGRRCGGLFGDCCVQLQLTMFADCACFSPLAASILHSCGSSGAAGCQQRLYLFAAASSVLLLLLPVWHVFLFVVDLLLLLRLHACCSSCTACWCSDSAGTTTSLASCFALLLSTRCCCCCVAAASYQFTFLLQESKRWRNGEEKNGFVWQAVTAARRRRSFFSLTSIK